MAHDVFVSYANEDKATADALVATLEQQQIRCWIAPRDVSPGKSYAEALVEAIGDAQVMVLVFSANANNSPHVMREVERAASKGTAILPLRIEDVAPSKSMEYFISGTHWLDALTPPLKQHLEQLARSVAALLDVAGGAPRTQTTARPSAIAPVTLELGPPRVASPFGASLAATSYDLTLRNSGDESMKLQLNAEDDDGHCAFLLPGSVTVPPRGETTVTMKVRPRSRRWRGGRETRRFSVAASGDRGGPPTTVSGQFEDMPYGWLPYGGGAVLCVALAAAIAVALLPNGDGSTPTAPSLTPVVESFSRTPEPTAEPTTDSGSEVEAMTATTGKIAFRSDRDGSLEIYVMNDDGSEPRRLTVNGVDDLVGSWSPDGRQIAFSSGGAGRFDLVLMNDDGSGQHSLTHEPASGHLAAAWSPDGSKIAFHSNRDGDNDIYVMNDDGSGLRNLTNNDASDGDPAWSPDGSRIAFQSDRDGDNEIYVMDADDGSNVTQLTTNDASDRAPAWSPDGSRIAFDSDRLNADFEIYVVDVEDSSVNRLTENNADDGAAAWSADGSRIAFVSDRDGDYEIYVMDDDGSNVTNLTNNHDFDAGPEWWSPEP